MVPQKGKGIQIVPLQALGEGEDEVLLRVGEVGWDWLCPGESSAGAEIGREGHPPP